MHRPGHLLSAAVLPFALALTASGFATAQEEVPEEGAVVYESKCLLCHPNSPGQADGPKYKARPDAVPLWTLFEAEDGWQESQVGLGQWSDDKIERFLANPKSMKPETKMVRVPMEPAQRQAVIRYIKHLGRKY